MPKSGKTYTASKFPKSLLLGFEKGYNAIPGIMAQPIEKWSDFKAVLRQLKTDEAKEKFKTIIVDTLDIAYSLCEKYVCAQNGVQAIGDIPFGKGFGALEKEYDETLRSILQMDYGLVMISHATDKTFTDEDGHEYNQIVPTLDKRGTKVTVRMADIVGYSRSVMDDDGNTHTKLFTRGTPRYVAGTRFQYFPESIDFTYKNLVDAIGGAVEALEKEFGADAVTSDNSNLYLDQTNDNIDVADLITAFGNIAGELVEKDEAYFVPRIQAITNRVLGKDKKISEATPEQVDLVQVALDELKELSKKSK